MQCSAVQIETLLDGSQSTVADWEQSSLGRLRKRDAEGSLDGPSFATWKTRTVTG